MMRVSFGNFRGSSFVDFVNGTSLALSSTRRGAIELADHRNLGSCLVSIGSSTFQCDSFLDRGMSNVECICHFFRVKFDISHQRPLRYLSHVHRLFRGLRRHGSKSVLARKRDLWIERSDYFTSFCMCKLPESSETMQVSTTARPSHMVKDEFMPERR